ncbi:hypothetical protein ASPSYDRAFT_49300 [Aspergillus sydowii CBS 593.65]|uniref:Uncharacterized protein n=1 Tax=Aspergillus sydowii CBS 593.65 TaxID=1036612 RepID=A0A1L9T6V6_9EURO|nr:uncharacterized protein ASPSYDRAFT_49300 [Aspergillus sydowii CBS 593.65]OJJ55137.1 hypothetical protein ASPSYDRAFT_49300 [Aspergillus sydowii CBS 593.65]
MIRRLSEGLAAFHSVIVHCTDGSWGNVASWTLIVYMEVHLCIEGLVFGLAFLIDAIQ